MARWRVRVLERHDTSEKKTWSSCETIKGLRNLPAVNMRMSLTRRSSDSFLSRSKTSIEMNSAVDIQRGLSDFQSDNALIAFQLISSSLCVL